MAQRVVSNITARRNARQVHASSSIEEADSLSIAFVAPRHPDGGDWPWLSKTGPMRKHQFKPLYIDNTFDALPKATRWYVQGQYLRAIFRIADVDLAFFFSTDIAVGMTGWLSNAARLPKRVYVGFTQDGDWSAAKVERLGGALRACDAVTVFSNAERDLYLGRYRLDPQRVHVIPIHTDELQGYRQYADQRPIEQPYVLSMGSPNRRFTSVARACADLKVPLVIITRPWHRHDSLDELASLGATIITDADKLKSLTYLKHAKFMVMDFESAELPGAFTTIIHGMFMNTPSVATNCLGMSEYVIDGETGFVTPHDDERSLSEAIDRMWNEPQLCDRFAENARSRAERLHSLDAAAQSFADLAASVMKKPS